MMKLGEAANRRSRHEVAALKCLYLVGTGRQRWTMRWEPALNAFAITFGDRMPRAENR